MEIFIADYLLIYIPLLISCGTLFLIITLIGQFSAIKKYALLANLLIDASTIPFYIFSLVLSPANEATPIQIYLIENLQKLSLAFGSLIIITGLMCTLRLYVFSGRSGGTRTERNKTKNFRIFFRKHWRKLAYLIFISELTCTIFSIHFYFDNKDQFSPKSIYREERRKPSKLF